MKRTKGAAKWRAWRVKHELTQVAAAIRMDVEPTYLAKIERGERRPGRVVALKIEKLSGVAVGDWDC